MHYHPNARLTLHQRVALAKKVLEQGSTLKAAAAAFNVSEKTAAKWVRRYRDQGPDSLQDRSSRPALMPRATPQASVEQAIRLRRLRWTGLRIAAQLGLSTATVSRILRRAGLHRLDALDPPPPVVRYEHPRPGDLIHFDIKRLARIVRPGHRVHGDRTRETRGAGYEFLHIAVDDHSRIACAAILPDQTSASATRFSRITAPATATGASKSCCAGRTSTSASPSPTPRAPTAKPNASSRPPCASGPTGEPINTQPSAPNSSSSGCTTTTSTAPMPASGSKLRPLAQA